jgi:methyl-accepting chemotaxis protein
MAEASTNAFDRFNDALRNLDDQIQDLRDRFDERRKKVEKRVEDLRDDVERQLRKSPLYRRAERIRKDIEEQVETTREQVYDVFGIASRAQVEKLNRKLNTISRKLNELAKETEGRPHV